MLAKHCLQAFKLDCQLRRLSDRTIKGYYNNTLNFLIYAEKHHEVTEDVFIDGFRLGAGLMLDIAEAHRGQFQTDMAEE